MRRSILPTISLIVLFAGFAYGQNFKTSAEARTLATFDARAESIDRAFSQRINAQVLREMQNAWLIAGGGMAKNEVVILLFKTADGSLRAETQSYISQPKSATFVWQRSAVAILHTHPNICDPKPSEIDKDTADKLGVSIFTLTSRGIYVYDPISRSTREVKKGLVWFNAKSWELADLDDQLVAANLKSISK